MEAPVATSRPSAIDQLAAVRVSYVLSTRNRKSELEKTLQNIRQFLCPEDELIIADGGSTDGTPELARKNEDIIARFISAPDYGEAHGINRAILASRGRYIKFLSDDDRIDPGAMRYCIDYLEADPEIDVVVAGGTTFRISPDGSKEFCWQHTLPEAVGFRDRIGSPAAVLTCGLGFLLRRDAVAVAGLFDTRKKYVDIAYLVSLLNSPLNIRYLNCRLFEHHWRPASGSYDLQNDTRFRDERALGLIALGDWKSVSHLQIHDVARSLRLAPAAGVEAALSILLLQHRLETGLARNLLGAFAQLIHYSVRIAVRIRRILAFVLRRVQRAPDNEMSMDERQANAATNKFHIWDSRAW